MSPTPNEAPAKRGKGRPRLEESLAIQEEPKTLWQLYIRRENGVEYKAFPLLASVFCMRKATEGAGIIHPGQSRRENMSPEAWAWWNLACILSTASNPAKERLPKGFKNPQSTKREELLKPTWQEWNQIIGETFSPEFPEDPEMVRTMRGLGIEEWMKSTPYPQGLLDPEPKFKDGFDAAFIVYLVKHGRLNCQKPDTKKQRDKWLGYGWFPMPYLPIWMGALDAKWINREASRVAHLAPNDCPCFLTEKEHSDLDAPCREDGRRVQEGLYDKWLCDYLNLWWPVHEGKVLNESILLGKVINPARSYERQKASKMKKKRPS